MPTREQAKKAWEHGRKGKPYYDALTPEQKSAFWSYGRDNGYISRDGLDDYKRSEFDKYVKTDWAQYAPKVTASHMQDALKADRYANYQGPKVPLKQPKEPIASPSNLKAAQTAITPNFMNPLLNTKPGDVKPKPKELPKVPLKGAKQPTKNENKMVPVGKAGIVKTQARNFSNADAFVLGAGDSLTLGAFNKQLKDDSIKDHSLAFGAGQVAGYIAPTQGALKIAGRPAANLVGKVVGKKALGKLATTATEGLVTGALVDTASGLAQGERGSDLTSRVKTGALWGIGIDLGLAGLGVVGKEIGKKLANAAKGAIEPLTDAEMAAVNSLPNEVKQQILQLPSADRLLLPERAMSKIELPGVPKVEYPQPKAFKTMTKISKIGTETDDIRIVDGEVFYKEKNSTTAKKGYDLFSNNKSRFGNERKTIILPSKLENKNAPSPLKGQTLKPNKPIQPNLEKRTIKPNSDYFYGTNPEFPKPLQVPDLYKRETPFTVFKGIESPTNAQKPLNNINTLPLENPMLKKTLNEAAVATENVRRSETGFAVDTWKDKPKLALKRETMERNLYDMIPDKSEAKKVIDTYIEPIKKGEADNVRSLNQLRDEVKKFNINSGSTESELIQKYGEGKITLDEVKAKTEDWQKVVDATKYFRGKYDELLTKANEVLTRNGYNPIPKRANYFPHQGEVDGIMKALGLESYELPTDINGLTSGFTPGKNFFANALERKGDKTSYDAIRGFDNYIEGVNRIIHHTDNIKRLRALEKDIRKTFEGTTHLTNFVTELKEYTNLLAGKKSTLDRGMEELVGRRIYKAADAVRKQLGANMVGANVSSALTNFIPLTQSLATTDKESFVRGMVGTIANVFKNDGFIDQSDYLVRRFGSDKLVTSAWQKPGKALGWAFKAVDGFTSQTITRAKYLEGLKKGLPEEIALKEANNYAAKIMADRSIGQVPTLFTSKTLAPLTQFQLEVNNQLSFLFKDMPQMYKGNKAALASAFGQVALYSYLFNNLYEKINGRRPAFDIIGVVKDAIEDYTNGNIDQKEATKRLVENTANQLPFASFYTGGRIPLSNALPDFMGVLSGDAKASEEALKPVTNVLLPTGGSQLNKTVKGLSTVLKGGAYTDSNRLRYPVEKNTSNLVKGALFGPSALPETQDYYDNKRAALGPEQTKQLQKAQAQGKDIKPLYNKILNERKISSLQEEIKKIRNDKELEWAEKTKRINKLMDEMKKYK